MLLAVDGMGALGAIGFITVTLLSWFTNPEVDRPRTLAAGEAPLRFAPADGADEAEYDPSGGAPADSSPVFLGEHDVVVPDGGERRGDAHLARYREAFPGAGVPELGLSSFWHFDLVSGGARWRFVVLDAMRRSLGRRWQDQVFWVPKVVGGDDFDRLVVLLAAPVASLAVTADNDPDSGAAALRCQRQSRPSEEIMALPNIGSRTSTCNAPLGNSVGRVRSRVLTSSVPVKNAMRGGPGAMTSGSR